MDNKLDFLMNLTGSKNNALSKAVSFDPSYVSRIRNGSRTMPRSPQFVEQAASYFSKRVLHTAARPSICSVSITDMVA